MSEPINKADLQFALDGAVHSIIHEMSARFAEVAQRLDRIDSTLVLYATQMAAGSRAMASIHEWVGKADADYVRVLAELAELKERVAKLEDR